jgi:hypothetical protein
MHRYTYYYSLIYFRTYPTGILFFTAAVHIRNKYRPILYSPAIRPIIFLVESFILKNKNVIEDLLLLLVVLLYSKS